MKAIYRLYKREETVTRSVHIDEELYEKVQYLSENVFDASASKIINVCIEHALLKENGIKFYKKPNNADSIYRSIVLKKSFYDELLKIKEETGISFSRLINWSIKQFLEDYKDEFSKK